MAAALQNLLDILRNLLLERCRHLRIELSRSFSPRLLLGAFSRCFSARLLLGALSRCFSPRLLLGAFSRRFGLCGFLRRQHGKPLARLRLRWCCKTGINLGRKTQGFFVICFSVRHLSLLLVSQAPTRVGRDKIWQN